MGSVRKKFEGNATSIVAVVTAFAASACCIGPTLLLALGLGGLGFASFLEPYRPYLLALTGIFLGAAFYFAYRPLKAEACAADSQCAPANRTRMRAMVWIASAVAILVGSYPYIAGARAEVPIENVGYKTVSLDVEGMTCGSCANHVRSELEKVPGVHGAVVRYPEGDARVELASENVSTESLLQAVERAGYSASPRSQDEAPVQSCTKGLNPPGGCCAPAPVTAKPSAASSDEPATSAEEKSR